MHTVELEEAKKTLDQLIDEVVGGGEIIITKDQHPLAKIVGVQAKAVQPTFGSAKGLIHMADNFEDPLEDFEDYQ